MLAKTSRDAFMVGLAGEHPDYGWEVNKGYATPYHRAALRAPRARRRTTGSAGGWGWTAPTTLDELAELADGADLEELAALDDAADAARPETVSGAPVDLTDGQDGVVRLGEEVRR